MQDFRKAPVPPKPRLRYTGFGGRAKSSWRFSATRENQLEIAGGLCRYHASGKELYTPHLIDFLERSDLGARGLADRIRALSGGRSRPTAATPSHRLSALALVDELVAMVGGADHPWEAHFLKNIKKFVQLEMIRAEDVSEDPDFGLEEKRRNLTWFLDEAYPDAKLIYWEGRGSSSELPTGAPLCHNRGRD